jgi:tetratricopeptide (TPR) repeat protein
MYYLIVSKNIITLFLVVFLGSCSVITEDLSQAKQYIEQRNYEEAIAALEKFDSKQSKQLNSQVHMHIGESILKNLDKPKLERYEEAKLYFEQAIKLDPKNSEARTIYLMLLKLLKQG